VNAAEALLDALKPDLECWRTTLLTAARWHDCGKVHPIFQVAMPAGAPRADIWAKSKGKMMRYQRPGFRHELSSAIAMLLNGHSDLAAYLVAAHHGKVRLSIRSLPHEKQPMDDPTKRFARGIWHGDVLTATDLGGTVTLPETTLDLSFMELGDGPRGESWLARMLALRDAPDLGPFRLAFLEATLRVSDWRASEEVQ
jgi:CRISPR-associated endonuclease/helicase Cas3